MATIDITVTDLIFPEKLEDKYCKFRPLISLRYRDSGDQVRFEREAIPGISKGDYWECEKGNKKRPNYVRDAANHRVDMNKIDISKRTITFSDIHLKSLETIIVDVYDIDVSGIWDKIWKNFLKMLPLVISAYMPTTLPPTLTLVKKAYEQGTGKTLADLEKGVIDKLMGKEDNAARSIFTRTSTQLTQKPSQTVVFKGGGIEGDYSVSLEITVS